MRPIVHAITPGDHFSPRTGSAVPTVVHGIASAAGERGDMRQAVLLDSSTYEPRYESADLIEYEGAPLPGLPARALDAAMGRLGLPRLSAARAFRPMADAMTGREPSFVLAHNAPALLSLLHRTPHSTLLYAHNDLLRTVGHNEAHRLLEGVPAIVCVSHALAEITASRLPPELAGRIRIVENGVDPALFHPPATPVQRGRPRILFLGRMVHDKGADVLLKAVAILQRDDLEVTVVGSAGFDAAAPLTAYEQSLRELAASCRAAVVFERFVDRSIVPERLRDADIFVVPSRWADPSPLTVGEAMASGLAVVGSRIGGIPEVLGDAGILVGHDDPRALAEALDHLVTDASARVRLAATARERALEQSWARTWEQLKAVLESVDLS